MLHNYLAMATPDPAAAGPPSLDTMQQFNLDDPQVSWLSEFIPFPISTQTDESSVMHNSLQFESYRSRRSISEPPQSQQLCKNRPLHQRCLLGTTPQAQPIFSRNGLSLGAPVQAGNCSSDKTRRKRSNTSDSQTAGSQAGHPTKRKKAKADATVQVAHETSTRHELLYDQQLLNFDATTEQFLPLSFREIGALGELQATVPERDDQNSICLHMTAPELKKLIIAAVWEALKYDGQRDI